MKVTIKAGESKAAEKMSIAFNNILERIATQATKEATDHIETVYNEKYKKDFETATIINDEPKPGELSFKKTKVDIKLRKEVYNKTGHITLEPKTEEDYLTLRSQDIGTGDEVNYKVLHKFGIETKGVKESELMKWYMNPKYHLTNFKKFLRNEKF